jgi:hypothetical protein
VINGPRKPGGPGNHGRAGKPRPDYLKLVEQDHRYKVSLSLRDLLKLRDVPLGFRKVFTVVSFTVSVDLAKPENAARLRAAVALYQKQVRENPDFFKKIADNFKMGKVTFVFDLRGKELYFEAINHARPRMTVELLLGTIKD